MLVGYMRVSKADGSQTLDLQRDALLVAGVEAIQILRGSGFRENGCPTGTGCAEKGVA